MNRTIEQALLSLIPTHNSALPQPLTDLASSLLAQSRHRASTLKAEEEIARPYACAHLACDRLKITLNLPPIDPRPPIPPRIYKRLFNHLDKILPATSSTPSRHTPGGTALGSGRIRTPSSKLREQQLLATSPLASKTRPTPSKEKSLADLRNQTTTPSRKRKITTTADPLPAWIRPTLRYLLSHLGPARIGPVVASALESIIAPHGKLTDDAWVQANLVSVLGALYLFVWRGVTWPDGEQVDRERYVLFRKEVAACLERARDEVEVVVPVSGGGREEDKGWDGWEGAKVREFDATAVRGKRHGWFEMEWVQGVRDLVERERVRVEEEGEGEGGEEVEVVQIRRPDTMFQERYDYLGERKRKAYAEWKEGMLKRIKELEAH
jgi:origin recognition complex subunit 6